MGAEIMPSMRRFQVALSFPGEYRTFVEQVAHLLADEIGRDHVLYDRYYEAEFARPDLDTYLQRLYHDESELIAVFLCAEYEAKEWCGLEWRAIRDLIKKGQKANVMPFRFDNTEIPGLFSTDGYVAVGARTPEQVADLILQRYGHEIIRMPVQAEVGSRSCPKPRETKRRATLEPPMSPSAAEHARTIRKLEMRLRSEKTRR